jgi:hypothetical protein
MFAHKSAQPLIDLQRRRGRFAELGLQMGTVAGAMSSEQRATPLLAAADAYRAAGDDALPLLAPFGYPRIEIATRSPGPTRRAGSPCRGWRVDTSRHRSTRTA